MYIKSEHLVIIVVVALICMTCVVSYALYLGINGAILATCLGVFGVIIGAVAKSIYDKKS